MAVYDVTETFWLGHSNTSEWVVLNDGVPVTDLSPVTRAVVTIGAIAVDSAVVGSSVIWWDDSVTGKVLSDGTSFTGDVIRARLGAVNLTAQEYEDCRLIIYDATHPNGLVVSDNIYIDMRAASPS